MEGSRTQGNPHGFPLTHSGCGHSGTASVTMARERQEPLLPAPSSGPWSLVCGSDPGPGRGGDERRSRWPPPALPTVTELRAPGSRCSTGRWHLVLELLGSYTRGHRET